MPKNSKMNSVVSAGGCKAIIVGFLRLSFMGMSVERDWKQAGLHTIASSLLISFVILILFCNNTVVAKRKRARSASICSGSGSFNALLPFAITLH